MTKDTKKNTPELWDSLWEEPSLKEDAFNFAEAEKSLLWARIQRIVCRKFGSFENLEVIEIGAGVGTHAALMAKSGAKITILDYSEKALERAKEFFKKHNLKAEFVQDDALSLSQNLLDKYDISLSFGLAEHFEGARREKIIKAHFDVLKNNGVTFISVPNKYSPTYRIYKFLAEIAGLWKVGVEYPFSRNEFKKICHEIDVEKYTIVGDSFLTSFQLINPFVIARKLLKLKGNLDISKIKKERKTFLDDFISYALILCGHK